MATRPPSTIWKPRVGWRAAGVTLGPHAESAARESDPIATTSPFPRRGPGSQHTFTPFHHGDAAGGPRFLAWVVRPGHACSLPPERAPSRCVFLRHRRRGDHAGGPHTGR